MTDKLATILMTSPGIFGPKIQRWLLEQFNCSLGNNLPASQCDPALCFEFPDAKHIIPMFGYKESWDRLLITWDEWSRHLPGPNVYYFNTGDGNHNGLDEPGSRGEINRRQFQYGRAYQENEFMHKIFPPLKTVVTHPFPLPGFDSSCYNRIPSDVWAWRFKYLMEIGPEFRSMWNIPDDKEIWGYWIDEDLECRDLADTGKICRDLGLSACLIYKAEHPALMDTSNPDPRTWMTDKAKVLLEGMRDA